AIAELTKAKGTKQRAERLQEISRIVSEQVGNHAILLMLPNIGKLTEVAERFQQRQANALLAFALAWYHADHRRYPKALGELQPKYLAEIPQDISSGNSLIYRPTGDGYLLYSVGPNGKDDGGRGREDEPSGDDIAVRMPLPELRKK